jgi:AraC-like DNA-binding protein
VAAIQRKRDGFVGEHHVIVPPAVVQTARRHPLLAKLLATASGHFPRAEGHYVDRPKGVGELIIILCWSGQGWLELGGVRTVVDAGEIVFVPARTAHLYGASDHDPWTIVWAHAIGSELSHFMRELRISSESPKLRLAAQGAEQLNFNRVWQIAEEGYSVPQLLASASALRFALSEMLRLRRITRAPTDRTEEALRRATHWMREHIEQKPKLRELARHAGASVSHLTTLFRLKMGYPPMDYFNRLKIQRACFLLDETTIHVKEIGASLGFGDPYYFSRIFRQIMGVSPRGYRASRRG